jgi:hypothetical protein
MEQTKPETSLKQIREEIWTKNKARERETDTHPCDNWKAEKCMCKGSCTCHWVEMTPDAADIIKSGPILDSNPEARKILKKALFPHDLE